MANYLSIPTELSFLIEKRDTEDRRKSEKERPQMSKEYAGRDRRSGKDRRKRSKKRPRS